MKTSRVAVIHQKVDVIFGDIVYDEVDLLRNMKIAGVAVKILLNYLLIGTPGIHIHGGPYASIACYGIVMIANIFYVCKYAEMRFNLKEWVLKPGAAAAVMGIAVWLMKHFLPVSRIVTVVEVAVGVAVYFGAALMLKVLSVDDIRSMIRRRGRAQ